MIYFLPMVLARLQSSWEAFVYAAVFLSTVFLVLAKSLNLFFLFVEATVIQRFVKCQCLLYDSFHSCKIDLSLLELK